MVNIDDKNNAQLLAIEDQGKKKKKKIENIQKCKKKFFAIFI